MYSNYLNYLLIFIPPVGRTGPSILIKKTDKQMYCIPSLINSDKRKNTKVNVLCFKENAG